MRLAAVDLSPRGAMLINTQRKRGQSEAYQAIAYNNGAIIGDGAGGLMQLVYTPPVPVWWVVDGEVGIVYKTDAAYNYLYTWLHLTPGDLDGWTDAFQLGMQHNQVQAYESRFVRKAWRLAAGVTYTCGIILGGGSGGTWNYHSGNNYCWIEAEAWTQ